MSTIGYSDVAMGGKTDLPIPGVNPERTRFILPACKGLWISDLS
jgi:hypothetical protein